MTLRDPKRSVTTFRPIVIVEGRFAEGAGIQEEAQQGAVGPVAVGEVLYGTKHNPNLSTLFYRQAFAVAYAFHPSVFYLMMWGSHDRTMSIFLVPSGR
jgi:hypothetical protein